METLEAQGYSKGLLDQLHVLQQNNVHCDARITAEGGGVSAHKVVLMAASSYLNSCLSTKVQSEPGSKGSIHIHDTPFRLIERVIKFIYTGKLAVCKEDFDMTFKLCKDLEITSAIGLFESCRISEKNGESSNFSDKTGSNHENLVNDVSPSTNKDADMIDNSETSGGDLISTDKLSLCRKEETEKSPDGKPLKTVDKSGKEGSVKKQQYPQRKSIRRESKHRQNKTLKVKKVTLKKKVNTTNIKHASSKLYKSKTEEIPAIPIVIENVDKDTHDNQSIHRSDAVVRPDDGLPQKEGKDKSDSIDNCDIIGGVKKKHTSMQGKRTQSAQNKVGDPKRKRHADTLRSEHKTKIKVRRLKKFPCTYCSKILTSHKRLAFHEFSKHGAPFDESRYTMYPCSKEGCTYVSGSRSNLRTHLKSRHADDRPHVCEFCGKAFKLPGVLAIHLNIHTGSKDWKCETCGEHFNQQSGLSVHIKRHHAGVSTWGELCHLCSEKFLQKSDLAWHLFRMHDQPLPEKYKAYVCDTCNYLTKSSQDLQRHKNAHNGIKQFACSVCKKSCSTKSQLKRHEKFHGEKSFKCMYENCSYACVDSIGLSKHVTLMHTHKNFKPYICPVCSYKTGVKGNLDKHIRQVHFLDVVTKHTVQLKMKYANFESGDIITKDGHLIASAKQRKEMHQKCLEENRMAVNSQEEMDHSVKSITQHDDTENKVIYQLDAIPVAHKPILLPMLPCKPVMSEFRQQETEMNDAINLSAVNSSYPVVNTDHHVHISESVPSNIALTNVVYLQDAATY